MGTLAVPTNTQAREAALGAIAKLPPFSPVLNKLMATLADEDVSFAELAQLIEKDTVLAGSVLRLVNSAFYARRGTVNSVRQAVSVLGITKLRNLSMSMSLSRMWNAASVPPGWSGRDFNLHGVGCAILGDLIAVEMNANYAEGAFSAGLLQNVGMLLIAIGAPDDFQRIRSSYSAAAQARDLAECEREHLGFDHQELSGEALRRWHLPAPIVEAVERHHGPHLENGPAALSWVVASAARMVEQQSVVAQPWLGKPVGSIEDTLAEMGLEQKSAGLLEAFHAEFANIKSFFG